MQICEALELLWTVRLIHGDISPHNVAFDGEVARLIDISTLRKVEWVSSWTSSNPKEVCSAFE